ncbi:MAG TPA: NUDIX domain-containing protein [Caulobacteraceae bacterium]|nr:NUDIX domain-containing protein [Caulobacteraceae bacterium]
MRRRPTVRVLLFDPSEQILLMKGRLPTNPAAPGAWFTLGGAIEAGESLQEAARREILEEAGFHEIALGPVVWRREAVFPDLTHGEMLFEESYLVARCAAAAPSRAHWRPWERELCDDIRWWPLADLARQSEPVFPAGLAALAVPIAAGDYPTTPVRID